MWHAHSERLPGSQTWRIGLTHDGTTPTVTEVLDAWSEDPALRRVFSETLAGLPPDAFCWELPPLTTATVEAPFECVAVASPVLARVRPDPTPFARYYSQDPAVGVVVFPNLGGDATLVVPCPRAADACYPHLAAFVRHAPAWQRDALWQRCSEAVRSRLSARPLWLSTAGLGVHWLHLRIDDTPKYYRHAPYRTTPSLR